MNTRQSVLVSCLRRKLFMLSITVVSAQALPSCVFFSIHVCLVNNFQEELDSEEEDIRNKAEQ